MRVKILMMVLSKVFLPPFPVRAACALWRKDTRRRAVYSERYVEAFTTSARLSPEHACRCCQRAVLPICR